MQTADIFKTLQRYNSTKFLGVYWPYSTQMLLSDFIWIKVYSNLTFKWVGTDNQILLIYDTSQKSVQLS